MEIKRSFENLVRAKFLSTPNLDATSPPMAHVSSGFVLEGVVVCECAASCCMASGVV